MHSYVSHGERGYITTKSMGMSFAYLYTLTVTSYVTHLIHCYFGWYSVLRLISATFCNLMGRKEGRDEAN